MVEVDLMWGVASLDKTGSSMFETADESRGSLVFDPKFNMSSTAFQNHVVTVCESAANNTVLTRSGEVTCFMDSFKTWVTGNASHFHRWLLNPTSTLPPMTDASAFPVNNQATFYWLLSNWYFLGGPANKRNQNMRDYRGQIGLSGTFPTNSIDVQTAMTAYSTLKAGGSVVSPTLTALQANMTSILAADSITAKFARVWANSTLVDRYQPPSSVSPHFELWDSFEKSMNTLATQNSVPSGALMQSSNTWVFMHTQMTYVKSALQGGGVSLALAFVVLLISTGNILISIYATLSLCGVVCTLLGFMVVLGWELGTIESLCATILVGLSVDYVVHLANSYIESHSVDRAGRVKDMIVEMGITVVGGAITSVGASAVLLLCKIQFFFKFGYEHHHASTCWLEYWSASDKITFSQ